MRFWAIIFLFFPSSLLFGQVEVLDSVIMVEHISIYFDTDSSNIKPHFRDSVSQIFSNYSDKKLERFRLEAHTDSIGSLHYNQKLSERRAASAVQLLKDLDVDTAGIEIVEHGELQPIVSNETEDGRSKNRRVDVGFYTVKKLGLLHGTIFSDTSSIPFKAKVKLRSKEYIDSVYTDTAGRFVIPAPMGEVVVIEANAKEHFFKSKALKITPGVLKNNFSLNLPRATMGKKFELENFYFVGNKPILLPKSIPVLHRLLEFMTINPEICIRIDGHINLPNQGPAPKESWHWKLSDDRTKTVYNFLVENEVFPGRMKRKAYANWQMVYPKAKEERLMKKNRRVEIMIIECTDQ